MSLLIHELAERAEVSRDTIRRLEGKGLIRADRDINNWRRYPPETVTVIRRLYAKEASESGQVR